MKNKETFFSIALASLVMFVMLMGVAGAAPFAYITNENNNTVSVIDTATNIVTATVPVGNAPLGVAVSPDGAKVYVTNSNSHTVSVIDTAGNTVINTLPLNGGLQPVGVAISPDGTKVYVTDEISNTVSVIDTTTNAVISVNVGFFPYGVAVSPDGTKVYVANQGSQTVSVIDTATNNVTATVSSGGTQPFGVAVSPDGTEVYVANSISNAVAVIDTATNNVTSVNVGLFPVGVAVSPDGTKVYITNANSGNVSVIDTTTNTVTTTITVGNTPFGVAVSPDGTKVYVANSGDNTVSVIDTATNAVTAVTVRSGPIAFGRFIGPLPILPVANFTTNVTSGYVPLTVQFTDHSTNVTGWNWDFGDGANSTLQNTTHTYSAAGNYTVNLTASNGNGTNSTLATITVNAIPLIPIANFSATPTSGTAPLNVSFTDTTVGTPTSWKWNFGDGKSSTSQNPSHIYQNPGTYSVSLTVKNANGTNTTTKTNFISVTIPPLVANFSATPTSGTTPLSVNFIDTSIGTPTSWAWNFGDGKGGSNKQNPVYTYKTAGTYTVSLTITDAFRTNTTTKTTFISVTNPPLVANFSATPTSGTTPLSVSFTDTSIGTPTSWAWNFGDGTTSKNQNPVYTYKTAGTYTVSLTVKDAFGTNTQTKTNFISVTNPPLVANFSATPTSGTRPLSVSFTDTSIGAPKIWSWNFGDGKGGSNKQNPVYTYKTAGTYTVSLTVNNGFGTDTKTKLGYITVS